MLHISDDLQKKFRKKLRFFESTAFFLAIDCGTRYSQFIRETKIAVELERLRSLRCSIDMAASREKGPAILGALRGRYINVLITDEETAKILLNE